MSLIQVKLCQCCHEVLDKAVTYHKNCALYRMFYEVLKTLHVSDMGTVYKRIERVWFYVVDLMQIISVFSGMRL